LAEGGLALGGGSMWKALLPFKTITFLYDNGLLDELLYRLVSG